MIERRGVKRSEDFVEKLATAVVVSYPNDGSVIVVDFLKPAMEIMVDERGRITGIRGELELAARVILPPIVCKRLLIALKNTVEKYESEFGEIRIERGTPGQESGATMS